MTTFTQWNNSADWYDQNMGTEGDSLNAKIIKPAIFALMGNLKGKSVLDAGCGSGYLTFEIAKKAGSVLGLDFAPNFISLCQKKYPKANLKFAQQDLTLPLPLPAQKFDLVISKMVLQYVPQIDTFTKESFRVLKPKGQLIVAVDHPVAQQIVYAQKLAGNQNPKYPNPSHYFDSQPQIKLSLWGKVKLTWYPRTISTYITTFLRAGFTLKDIVELPETKDGLTYPRVLLLSFAKTI